MMLLILNCHLRYHQYKINIGTTHTRVGCLSQINWLNMPSLSFDWDLLTLGRPWNAVVPCHQLMIYVARFVHYSSCTSFDTCWLLISTNLVIIIDTMSLWKISWDENWNEHWATTKNSLKSSRAAEFYWESEECQHLLKLLGVKVR